MGAGGEDILLSPHARSLFPYSIECKNTETLHLWKAIQQAEANAGDYKPLVIFKRNREKVRVIIEFDDFLELIYDIKKTTNR